MGALASQGQRDEVRARIADLSAEANVVYGNRSDFDLVDADVEKGAFFKPTLLHCARPLSATAVHSVEAFGPVSTVLPYADLDEAIEYAVKIPSATHGSIEIGPIMKFE